MPTIMIAVEMFIVLWYKSLVQNIVVGIKIWLMLTLAHRILEVYLYECNLFSNQWYHIHFKNYKLVSPY